MALEHHFDDKKEGVSNGYAFFFAANHLVIIL